MFEFQTEQDPNAASLLDVFNYWLKSPEAKKRQAFPNGPPAKKAKKESSSSSESSSEDEKPPAKKDEATTGTPDGPCTILTARMSPRSRIRMSRYRDRSAGRNDTFMAAIAIMDFIREQEELNREQRARDSAMVAEERREIISLLRVCATAMERIATVAERSGRVPTRNDASVDAEPTVAETSQSLALASTSTSSQQQAPSEKVSRLKKPCNRYSP